MTQVSRRVHALHQDMEIMSSEMQYDYRQLQGIFLTLNKFKQQMDQMASEPIFTVSDIPLTNISLSYINNVSPQTSRSTNPIHQNSMSTDINPIPDIGYSSSVPPSDNVLSPPSDDEKRTDNTDNDPPPPSSPSSSTPPPSLSPSISPQPIQNDRFRNFKDKLLKFDFNEDDKLAGMIFSIFLYTDDFNSDFLSGNLQQMQWLRFVIKKENFSSKNQEFIRENQEQSVLISKTIYHQQFYCGGDQGNRFKKQYELIMKNHKYLRSYYIFRKLHLKEDLQKKLNIEKRNLEIELKNLGLNHPTRPAKEARLEVVKRRSDEMNKKYKLLENSWYNKYYACKKVSQKYVGDNENKSSVSNNDNDDQVHNTSDEGSQSIFQTVECYLKALPLLLYTIRLGMRVDYRGQFDCVDGELVKGPQVFEGSFFWHIYDPLRVCVYNTHHNFAFYYLIAISSIMMKCLLYPQILGKDFFKRYKFPHDRCGNVLKNLQDKYGSLRDGAIPLGKMTILYLLQWLYKLLTEIKRVDSNFDSHQNNNPIISDDHNRTGFYGIIRTLIERICEILENCEKDTDENYMDRWFSGVDKIPFWILDLKLASQIKDLDEKKKDLIENWDYLEMQNSFGEYRDITQKSRFSTNNKSDTRESETKIIDNNDDGDEEDYLGSDDDSDEPDIIYRRSPWDITLQICIYFLWNCDEKKYNTVEKILKRIQQLFKIHFIDCDQNTMPDTYIRAIFIALYPAEYRKEREKLENSDENDETKESDLNPVIRQTTSDVEIPPNIRNEIEDLLKRSQYHTDTKHIYFQCIPMLLSLLGCNWGIKKLIQDLNSEGCFEENLTNEIKRPTQELEKELYNWQEAFIKIKKSILPSSRGY